MKHIPTRLMQKVKTHFDRNRAKKFDKQRFEEFQDESLYTGAVGSADIHRLKSLEHTDKKHNVKAVKI
jgi:hypothetical protein